MPRMWVPSPVGEPKGELLTNSLRHITNVI
jgi:hypothetical protein